MGYRNVLAFDFGASNGKAVLGRFDGERVEMKVVHEFENGAETVFGSRYWDFFRLCREIKRGIGKAAAFCGTIDSIAFDTWGVDYGLIDRNGDLMSNPYFYRDSRTDGLMEEVTGLIPREEIYRATGVQFMPLNTIYQLYADLKYRPWVLENAADMLFMPDLMNFFLTGLKYNERTIASTSQLFDPVRGRWADFLFEGLGLPPGITCDMIHPGETIGPLRREIGRECGIPAGVPVVAVGSHDTSSAVAATPLESADSGVYISTGTWCLLGMELDAPFINEKSLAENFTNECGVGGRIRFLKNICGLWLIQECRRIWAERGLELSYGEIEAAAVRAGPAHFRLDPDDGRFHNPPDMPAAIEEYCRETGQPVPRDHGETARGIYESLAGSFDAVINALEHMLDRRVDTVNMVGGGIRAELLCRLTAACTGRRVIAGPAEATALGNITVQLNALGETGGLAEGREIIRRSVEVKEYRPW